jgi:hypothetical protein
MLTGVYQIGKILKYCEVESENPHEVGESFNDRWDICNVKLLTATT